MASGKLKSTQVLRDVLTAKKRLIAMHYAANSEVFGPFTYVQKI